jgi:hypothetical protein
VTRSDATPALLDVVPWNYGYAHSWALAWLIENDRSRSSVLALLTPYTSPPWTLAEPVAREHRVPGARADLAVRATDGRGRTVSIAIETKVADRIKPAQLAFYRDEGYETVLYVPGLTGLLYAPNGPIAGERWINGHDLVRAAGAIELPWIISSYIKAVAAEASRMDDARAFARGELDDFAYDGRAPYEDLMDAAWLVEVVSAMRADGADDIRIRTEANDRGLYWGGSWCDLAAGNGAGLYVDVIAELRTHACAVALKVTGGDQAGRRACYDTTIAAGPPSDADWRASRPPSRSSGRIWTLDAGEMPAEEAARHTLAAGDFIARVANGDGHSGSSRPRA